MSSASAGNASRKRKADGEEDEAHAKAAKITADEPVTVAATTAVAAVASIPGSSMTVKPGMFAAAANRNPERGALWASMTTPSFGKKPLFNAITTTAGTAAAAATVAAKTASLPAAAAATTTMGAVGALPASTAAFFAAASKLPSLASTTAGDGLIFGGLKPPTCAAPSSSAAAAMGGGGGLFANYKGPVVTAAPLFGGTGGKSQVPVSPTGPVSPGGSPPNSASTSATSFGWGHASGGIVIKTVVAVAGNVNDAAENAVTAPVLSGGQQVSGEENDTQVVVARGKLYIFSKDDKGWQERGHGTLTLNDPKESASTSRLVMRQDYSKRLCLNAPIWAGLNPAEVGGNSLQFTGHNFAQGTLETGVFLFKAQGKELSALLREVQMRVKRCPVVDVPTLVAGPLQSSSAEPPSKAGTDGDPLPALAGVDE